MSERGVIAAAILLLGTAVRCEPPVSSPAAIRATIRQLWSNDGNEAAAAVTALSADPLALPVLRRALATDSNPRHQGDLERVIARVEAAQDEVLVGRIEQWAKDCRLDLLTEVRSLTKGAAADRAYTRLVDAGQSLRKAGMELLGDRLAGKPGGFLVRLPGPSRVAFERSTTTPLFDTELTLPEKETRTHLALFADRLTLPCEEIQESVLVARSTLDLLPNSGRCELTTSLVFANNPFPIGVVGDSVVVVDGNVGLLRPTRLSGSVIVVNGDLTRDGEFPEPGFDCCLMWATGNVTLPAPRKPANAMFLAGGKVANADKLAAKGCVEEDVKEPPLPVRFLDPAEFGLTLDATKDGMKVTKVADKCAFAEAGLSAGDVIARVGEVATATAPAFRRELRRGVVEGAVLLDVVRGKEKVELLVAVPDVPAVGKKAGLKAPPPEKKDK